MIYHCYEFDSAPREASNRRMYRKKAEFPEFRNISLHWNVTSLLANEDNTCVGTV